MQIAGKIFKYLKPERIDILKNLQIRITQPKFLNDVFDQYISFKKIIPKELFEQHFNPGIKKTIRRLPFDNNVKKGMENSTKEYFKTIFSDKNIDIVNYFNEMFNKTFGVLCFTKSPDNVPMWAHYTDIYKGFVLIFNSDHSFFHKGIVDDKDAGYLRKVNYVTEKNGFDSVLDLKDKTEKLFFEKHVCWQSEEEWRMILPLNKSTDKKDPDIFLISFPSDLINGIIFGIYTDIKLIDYVKELKQDKLKNLKLYKSFPNYEEYKMDISEI